MRGDRNFKGFDSSDPSVYFLFCGRYILNLYIFFVLVKYCINMLNTITGPIISFTKVKHPPPPTRNAPGTPLKFDATPIVIRYRVTGPVTRLNPKQSISITTTNLKKTKG